ncbi:phycocyanobilin lyase [Hydrococcus rivularis NIES-593]|uniref:Phycocyanobilin lyase n=1 Tax=Hydrococcus rivularis NIES-593 TaxID=1921803 RepID=A0A1U7HRL3_9CYAN|nr:HEAT repeat domain-containing protein [Hydrococcus rivularis]OKH26211.1 phycocyanobilin lyase [Hydrococcus rivularis NIES-593]
MEINQIEACLKSSDSQDRLKAIVELRRYDSKIAVPLLLTRIRDQEFIVRSFVAMGLGRKQSAEAFAALLELMQFDRDPNVRSEAANSLSFYGEIAMPHLVTTFYRDDHWLVRRSILAAMVELNSPEELFEVCACGLEGEDLTVQEASVNALGLLAGTIREDAALEKLLALVKADWWRMRAGVAKALAKFDDPRAKEALLQLKEDADHRVVGAVLESLL